MARLLLRPTPVNPLPSDATSSQSHGTSGRGLGFGVPWRLTQRLDLRMHSPAPLVFAAPPLSSFTVSVRLNPRDAPSSDPSLLTSCVGSPAVAPAPPLQWSFERQHLLVLNVIACATAISASWLFISAIPTLLAFKRAAESLEKLLDVTREELPDTMAAVRLSGMEISDLTMELSDLGQEISQGVRSSTRAVKLAEDRLRRFTTMSLTASIQVPDAQKNKLEGPPLARAARNLKDSIVKGRALLGVISSLTRFSRWVWNFWASRGQKRSV